MIKSFTRNWLAAIAAILLPAMALGGCATTPLPDLPAEVAQQSDGEYRLGLGDRMRINVYGERELSGEYQVSGTGVVTMPLIGDTPVVGLTAREVERRLTQRLAEGFLVNPSVSAEVYDFRPYFIVGEVERPGRYPTLEGTTLIGAIAGAGGFTYRANRNRVFLRRAGNPVEYQVDPNTAVMVAPGDTIRVGERHF